MKILIIGSEGFVGKHCVNYFSSRGLELIGVDIFDYPTHNYNYVKKTPEFDFYRNLLSKRFDVIINCGGNSDINLSLVNPIADFELNSYETIKILDAIKNYSALSKYIHLSSAAVYGNPESLPIKEDSILTPISPYGFHKLIAENICSEYSKIFNCKIVILRPFSIYGPGLKKQMFWDWHKKIVDNPQMIELHGNGGESRDYIYIDDLVEAISMIIEKSNFEGDVYNIASGSETFIKDVARIFFYFDGSVIDYKFNNIVRNGDPLNWRADISKLKSIGYQSTFSLEMGITELKHWLFK